MFMYHSGVVNLFLAVIIGLTDGFLTVTGKKNNTIIDDLSSSMCNILVWVREMRSRSQTELL